MVAQNCHSVISTIPVPCSDQSTTNSVVPNSISTEVGQVLSIGPCGQGNIATELSSQQPNIIHLSLTETMIEQQANGRDQSQKKKELKHFLNSDSYDTVSLGSLNLSNILKVPECSKIQVKTSCAETFSNMYGLPEPKESSSVSCDGPELNNISLTTSLSVGKNLADNHGVNGELNMDVTCTRSLTDPWSGAKKKKIIIKQLPLLDLSVQTDNKVTVRKSLRRQTGNSCFIRTPPSEPKTRDASNLDISKNYLSRTFADEDNKKCNNMLKSTDVEKNLAGIECIAQKSHVTSNCVFEKKKILFPKQKAVVLTVSPSKTKSNIMRKKRTRAKSVKHKNRCLVKKKRKRKEAVLDTVTINIPSQKPRRPKLSLGPYIHIVGTKERPLSVSVINLALTGEEIVKPRVQVANRNPNRRLLIGHVSTLSSAYDAVTKDETWLCAFCHRRSHVDDLGDLFGPYYMQDDNPKREDDTSQNTNVCNPVEFSKCCSSCTKDRKNSTYSEFLGQTISSQIPGLKHSWASPDMCSAQPSGTTEFWVHESCAFWAHGVYLTSVDQEVTGLSEAVREAADMLCCHCQLTGAVVGCWMKHCPKQFHYICAKERGYQLNEETFSALCPQHKKVRCMEC
ncbi:uncharacterized protein LOC143257900 isoform X1 [Tachypleus tridentatus]|uniref:uncharacterized protein LOC143257900 isoform X1 n=1 Tax=Tachypleus tridentatus TaxID=6853 RepID=UPI003FD0D5E7